MGRDVDHSPPPSAKVRNEWSYTFTPPLYLHGGRRDFDFLLLLLLLLLLYFNCCIYYSFAVPQNLSRKLFGAMITFFSAMYRISIDSRRLGFGIPVS